MDIPFGAQFEIENGCTHRCSHCYNGWFLDIRPSNPAKTDVIDSIAQSDLFEITLTGGEPLFI